MDRYNILLLDNNNKIAWYQKIQVNEQTDEIKGIGDLTKSHWNGLCLREENVLEQVIQT